VRCMRTAIRSVLGLLAFAAALTVPAPTMVSASTAVTPRPAAEPLVYHRNVYVGTVPAKMGTRMVPDKSRPIYKNVAKPIYGPKYETRTERYISGYTTVRVVVGEEPIYATRYETRTERYISGYTTTRVPVGEEPIYATRQVCAERWRSTCVRYVSQRYVAGYRTVYATRSTPVYATRTVRVPAGTYVAGYRTVYGTKSVPTYATRTVQVKVCSACVIEGYTRTMVLDGYELKSETYQISPARTITDSTSWSCNAPVGKGCSNHAAHYSASYGIWFYFSSHSDGSCVQNCTPPPATAGKPTVCPAGSVLAGQAIPADGNCNPPPPPARCPAGSELAGQVVPASGNCNPTPPPPPRCPAGSVLAGQVVPASGNCNPSASISIVPLTVTASSHNLTTGAAKPAITGTASPNVARSGETCTTNYTASSPAGTYWTRCSGGSASGYSVSYIAGSITVSDPAAPPSVEREPVNPT
jgi:hypothetical protein